MRPGLLAGGRWGAQCPGPPCLPGERRGETGLPWAPHVCPGVAAGAPEDHSQEGRAGAARSAGRGSYAAGRWRPAPLPLPCGGGAGGPAPGHGGVRMGTSTLPGEQAWAAWQAPAGHPHLLKCCPLVGGGANPQTHDLQARPSEEARRSCGHVTPRPGTHHGWEDGSDGPEAQAASVPAGPGDT